MSGGESSARFLHRWQRDLGLGERSRANVDARGLGGALAGLAAIVISSPVAGFRPLRFICAGLTRTVSCTRPPTRLLRVAELLEHDLLQRPEDSLGLGPRNLGAVSDGTRELCLS